MTCTACKEMRDKWLAAVIDRDIGKVAKVTVAAVKHIAHKLDPQPTKAPAKVKNRTRRKGR